MEALTVMTKEEALAQLTAIERDEFVKASGAIHINHKVTLIQQRLWNVLVANAHPNLGKQTKFAIPVANLLKYFPDTHNLEELKRNLIALTETSVEYNIFNKDGKGVWGFFTMLAGGKIEDGICSYGFYHDLQIKLTNPGIYTKLSLMLQARFGSKYSLFLYELCLDYIGVKQTPWMTVEQFRKYMGVEKDEYPQFKTLNMRTIQPAIQEINKITDLKIEVEFQTKGRKITAIKFLVERPRLQLEMALDQPTGITPLLDQLYEAGIPVAQAEKLCQEYPAERIEEVLKMVKSSSTPIKSKSGYIVKALQKGWQAKIGEIHAPEAPLDDVLTWFNKLDQNTRGILVRDFGQDTKKSPKEWLQFLEIQKKMSRLSKKETFTQAFVEDVL